MLVALVVAGALAANAVAALRSVSVLEQGFQNEERPAEVQRTLLALLSAVQDAETGQRGYLLTGDPAYLEPHTSARPASDSLLAALETLVSWNPLQTQRLPPLRQRIDDKLDELDDTIRLRREGREAAAIAVVRSDRGRRSMDDIRERVADMLDEARRVRSLYSRRVDRAARDARRSAWASTAALAALLIVLGLGTRAADRQRQMQADGLRQANMALEGANRSQAEAMAALSTALGEREAALGRVRAMQAQLVQQEKLAGMGRLTAGVAHEIKNPLNFVTNFAALTSELAAEATEAAARGDLQEVQTLLGSVAQNAEKISAHGQRADDIVQSMLVHARGVTGTRRAVSVGETVQAAVEQAVGPNGPDRVALTVGIDADLPLAEIVPESVTRAVRNLVENALHAVRQRDGAGDDTYAPAVAVTARPGTDHDGHAAAVVRVEDNGAGIPDDLFPRIFEPFFTTKGPGSGTGLGLSLAHDIAVGHGGSLLAERPAGGGAAFVLTLPLAASGGTAGMDSA